MKKFSTLVMGLACMTMLASCAKTVTAEEAAKIANGWTVSAATSAYKGYKLVTKNSDGSTSTTEDKNAITVAATITTMVAANIVVVNAAAAATDSTFKADGNALELSYKDSDGNYVYKTNAEGLTVYSKAVTGSSWSELSYTWYK